MHRNVAEFTSSTLVISHVIVYYPSMIPVSETILLSMSQTEFIYVLGYRWNFAQFYLIIYKINRTQPSKQLTECTGVNNTGNFPPNIDTKFIMAKYLNICKVWFENLTVKNITGNLL